MAVLGRAGMPVLHRPCALVGCHWRRAVGVGRPFLAFLGRAGMPVLHRPPAPQLQGLPPAQAAG